MTKRETIETLQCEILDEELELSLAELCRACALPAERILELVEYGVIEPASTERGGWRFEAVSIRRVRSAERLSQDLGLNLAGVALALELLDELTVLRSRLERLGDMDD